MKFSTKKMGVNFFLEKRPRPNPRCFLHLWCCFLAKKFHKRGGGSSGFHTSIFFLISNVNAPTYKQKKISFHKTPTGGGGHRFMKLFRKIDFFKWWLPFPPPPPMPPPPPPIPPPRPIPHQGHRHMACPAWHLVLASWVIWACQHSCHHTRNHQMFQTSHLQVVCLCCTQPHCSEQTGWIDIAKSACMACLF